MPDMAAMGAATPMSYAVAASQQAAAYKIAQDKIAGDVTGDGQVDFANPTGQAQRGKDNYGFGYFGASRTGHIHEGVDYVSNPGQEVRAPIAGFVTKVGFPYKDSSEFRYIEITNRSTGYTARVMYVGPEVQVGQTLALGQVIGHAQNLKRRYPNGITNHVHLEIAHLGGHQIDCAKLIPTASA
jgi:murein DD-endopeptidase MepM/ murein hydrolase activator NlpD